MQSLLCMQTELAIQFKLQWLYGRPLQWKKADYTEGIVHLELYNWGQRLRSIATIATRPLEDDYQHLSTIKKAAEKQWLIHYHKKTGSNSTTTKNRQVEICRRMRASHRSESSSRVDTSRESENLTYIRRQGKASGLHTNCVAYLWMQLEK